MILYVGLDILLLLLLLFKCLIFLVFGLFFVFEMELYVGFWLKVGLLNVVCELVLVIYLFFNCILFVVFKLCVFLL